MDTRYRLVALVVLLVATFGVCVQYAGVDLRDHPEESGVVENPGAYDGEKALLFGRVVSVSPKDAEITVAVMKLDVTEFGFGGVTKTVSTHKLRVLVSNSATLEEAEPGSEVQVFGTLRDGGDFLVAEEEEIVVDIQGPEDWWYVMATSLLGAFLASGYFLAHWRIDLRRLHFVERGTEAEKGANESSFEEEDG